jgi:hypothetical protein
LISMIVSDNSKSPANSLSIAVQWLTPEIATHTRSVAARKNEASS